MRPGFLQRWNGVFVRRLLMIWLPLEILLVVLIGLAYRTQTENINTLARNNGEHWVQLAKYTTNAELEHLYGDVLYLAGQEALQQWLITGNQNEKRQFSRDMLNFAVHRGRYDQIRFIDLNGQERVRINWDDGHPVVVPGVKLQNKAGRYYVRKTLALNRGEIYISSFDLNIEHGKIEQPFKPTIRFGTPVFDRHGHKRGIIVINYLGQFLLNQLRAIPVTTHNSIWLINNHGYWLLGPKPSKEWGFMFPGHNTARFATRYPQAWDKVKQTVAQGQFKTKHGLFTFDRITPLHQQKSVSDSHWVLVNYLPSKVMAGYIKPIFRQLAFAFGVLTLLLISMSGVISWTIERRRQQQEQVRASEARVRSMLDSAPDPIVIIDQSGRIVLINLQTEKKFGYRRDELIGQPVEILVPERFHKDHVKDRSRYMDSPVTRPMGEGAELYGRRKDGSEFSVEISLSPIETDQGLLVTSIVRDITERKHAEKRIQQLNEQLQSRAIELQAINHELEAFSYSVSHDLRAPLRAMDGFSHTLLREYEDKLDEKGQDRLERIRAAAQRMSALIDDLLKLSRISRTEVQREEIDLAKIAGEIIQSLQQQEPGRNVQISLPETLVANGDPRLLRVVMDNLLANAWKFTGKRPDSRIEVGMLKNEDDELFYYVRDNGAGFDMNYVDKLFGAFQRLHDNHEFPGTGIGLATVQRVIHKHGGRIWAESTLNQGAAFFFTLNG